MLEVEPIGQRDCMATISGQNVLEIKKLTCHYLENQARLSSIPYYLLWSWSSVSPNHRKGPKWSSAEQCRRNLPSLSLTDEF